MKNIKKVTFTKEIVIESKWLSYLPESYGAFLCNEDGLHVVRVINTTGELIKVIPVHMIESYIYAARSQSNEPVRERKKSKRSGGDNHSD